MYSNTNPALSKFLNATIVTEFTETKTQLYTVKKLL